MAEAGADHLDATDRLLLLYNAGVAALILWRRHRLPRWRQLLLLHGLLAAAVPATAHKAHEAQDTQDEGADGAPAWDWLHTWLPFAVITAFYEEAGTLRHVLMSDDLDHTLVAWEHRLLGEPYYLTAARGKSPAEMEAWHGLYMSYYGLLVAPGILAAARGKDRVREYVFVAVLSLLLHYAFGIAVPVSGPAQQRSEVIPQGRAIIPVMNRIHAVGTHGGLAFPSTHVAASLIAADYAGTWFPRQRLPFLAWFGLISVSTVVCTYHYVLDVVTGFATGAACLRLGRRLWRRWGRTR